MITLDKYGTGDAIGNLITLLFTVALPAAILVKARATQEVKPA
jgi:hypothetical protein